MNILYEYFLPISVSSNKIALTLGGRGGRRSRQFQGTCVGMSSSLFYLCFPRTHEFLSNLMRVHSNYSRAHYSRETRETKLPWYPEFMNGPTTYLVSRSLRHFRETPELAAARKRERERGRKRARERERKIKAWIRRDVAEWIVASVALGFLCSGTKQMRSFIKEYLKNVTTVLLPPTASGRERVISVSQIKIQRNFT